MTKKDHTLLAEAIRGISSRETRLVIVNSLIFRLKGDDRSFNPDKFEKACSV